MKFLKILMPLICVVAIIIAINIFLKGYGGVFPFRPSRNGDVDSSNISTGQITESITAQLTCIEITISGAEYLYQDESITIESLLEIAKDSNAEIRIHTDKTATINALDNLENILKENNLTYLIGDQ